MTGEAVNYFVCANSAKGFVNHFASNLANLERLYILKGGPGTGKSTMMSRVGEEFRLGGYAIERMHCSGDSRSLDGVIIKELKVGLVDGTSPHVIEPKAPGAVEEYVNLGVAWDSEQLISQKAEIMGINQQIAQCYSKAYALLAQSQGAYGELENFYSSKVDGEKQAATKATILGDVFKDGQSAGGGQVIHRFFEGITAGGMVNYLANIIQPIGKCYYLKGQPGTGKSQLLEAVFAVGLGMGYDLEVYHFAYDPDRLDMVIIRALDICLFDATGSHECTPKRHGDPLVNLDEALGEITKDEQAQIVQLAVSWQEQVDEAITYMAKAKALHDALEAIYSPAVDFTIVEQIGDVIIEEIAMLAEQRT